MLRIGIIGSSGRHDDEKKLTKQLYSCLITQLSDVFMQDERQYTLVSGGSSWMDHMTVYLYLKHPNKFKLVLYIPCNWDSNNSCYEDNGVVDWKSNPGGTLNYYHRKFSSVVGEDSLKQISTAITNGAIVNVESGMFKRNNLIASNVDVLYAFTFTNKQEPSSSGTLSTWKQALNKGIICHNISLNQFL